MIRIVYFLRTIRSHKDKIISNILFSSRSNKNRFRTLTEHYLITFEEFNKLIDWLSQYNTVSGVKKRNRFAIDPVMIKGKQEENFPLSQLIMYNFNRTNSASKFVQKYFSKQIQESGLKDEETVVIGHSCDGRALVELSKRYQLDFDKIFLIVLEDIGIIPAKQVLALLKKENIDPASVTDEFMTTEKISFKLSDGSIKEFKLGEEIDIHDNCQRCYRKKLDSNFDLSVSWITLEPFSNQLILKVGSKKGAKALEDSVITKSELTEDKINALSSKQEELMETAKKRREKDLAEFLARDDRINAIGDCNMCGICINACPVCFCASCVLQKQRKEKTIDNLTYQLTRISHIGDSCVGCGKCDQTCPKDLPLSLYFQSVNDMVKKEFNYIAGTDLKQEMPRSYESFGKSSEY